MSDTIFESLREDHDHQRHLIDALVDTEGDSKTRQRLYEELKANMANHAAAEERFFYGPLIDVDVTQKHARHSIAEHHELDQLVEKLDGLDMSAAEWLKACKQLQHRLLHHLAEEEKEIFPLAGKHLTETDKSRLAQHYRSMMQQRESAS